jgi:hypothetical protein
MNQTMNSRERIEAALNHREPDRTPIFEYVLLSPLADYFLGHPYAGDSNNWDILLAEKGWEAGVRQNAVDRVDLAIRLGHDMLYITPNPAPEEPGENQGSAPAREDPVEILIQRNAFETSQPPISEDRFLVYHFVKEEMERRGVDLPILAPAYLHGVWTDIELMQTMVLAPEIAHQHFEIATRKAMEIITRFVSLGIDLVGIGGDFSGTRPLISPKAYRSFIVPEMKLLSTRLHQDHIYAVNASDGDLWPVIDDFLTGTGVDGYLEIDLHAGMDLGKLKQKYGKQITFFGNLDCGIELSFGTPEIVRQHTLDCIQAGLGEGGHILCASNAITASVPLGNYLAVMATYRERFGLPRLD